jgi:ABC-type transporter Mla subunit MlaD
VNVANLHELGRVAQRLSDQTRAAGDQVGAAQGVRWQSTRAEAYRADLAAEAEAVRAAADELARAAAALHHHADGVQARLDQISALARWFDDRVDAARRTLASTAEDTADAALAGARRIVDAARSAPSPGSLAWDAFASRFR